MAGVQVFRGLRLHYYVSMMPIFARHLRQLLALAQKALHPRGQLCRTGHDMLCCAMQVGSEVARRGIGLGFANVIAYDPYASEVKAAALGVKLVSWEEALAQADFFSLHMPQTPQTKVSGASRSVEMYDREPASRPSSGSCCHDVKHGGLQSTWRCFINMHASCALPLSFIFGILQPDVLYFLSSGMILRTPGRRACSMTRRSQR